MTLENYREKNWKKLTTNIGKAVLFTGAAMLVVHPVISRTGSVAPSPAAAIKTRTEEIAKYSLETYEDAPEDTVGTETAETAADDDLFAIPAQGVLTSPFGSRWGRQHTGIDIGAQQGADIVAAKSGRVIYSGWADGYGYYVILDHGDGLKTAYGHCSALFVNEGDNVLKGQKIAGVGSTGNSTGPHLHFEVKCGDVYQDPLNYVTY